MPLISCQVCLMTFNNASDFTDHFMQMHTTVESPQTKIKITSERVLEIMNKVSKCKSNKQNTSDRTSNLQYGTTLYSTSQFEHQFEEKGSSLLSAHNECKICWKRIPVSNYTGHIFSHIGAMPYFCNLCDFSTISKLHLQNHFLTHDSNVKKSSLKSLLKKYRHECERCDSTFYSLSELVTHYVAHIKEMPFTCSLCDVKFIDKNDFIIHNHIHKFTIECDICHNIFTDRAECLFHVLSHNKSKFFCKFVPLLAMFKLNMPNYVGTQFHRKSKFSEQNNNLLTSEDSMRKDDIALHSLNEAKLTSGTPHLRQSPRLQDKLLNVNTNKCLTFFTKTYLKRNKIKSKNTIVSDSELYKKYNLKKFSIVLERLPIHAQYLHSASKKMYFHNTKLSSQKNVLKINNTQKDLLTSHPRYYDACYKNKSISHTSMISKISDKSFQLDNSLVKTINTGSINSKDAPIPFSTLYASNLKSSSKSSLPTSDKNLPGEIDYICDNSCSNDNSIKVDLMPVRKIKKKRSTNCSKTHSSNCFSDFPKLDKKTDSLKKIKADLKLAEKTEKMKKSINYSKVRSIKCFSPFSKSEIKIDPLEKIYSSRVDLQKNQNTNRNEIPEYNKQLKLAEKTKRKKSTDQNEIPEYKKQACSRDSAHQKTSSISKSSVALKELCVVLHKIPNYVQNMQSYNTFIDSKQPALKKDKSNIQTKLHTVSNKNSLVGELPLEESSDPDESKIKIGSEIKIEPLEKVYCNKVELQNSQNTDHNEIPEHHKQAYSGDSTYQKSSPFASSSVSKSSIVLKELCVVLNKIPNYVQNMESYHSFMNSKQPALKKEKSYTQTKLHTVSNKNSSVSEDSLKELSDSNENKKFAVKKDKSYNKSKFQTVLNDNSLVHELSLGGLSDECKKSAVKEDKFCNKTKLQKASKGNCLGHELSLEESSDSGERKKSVVKKDKSYNKTKFQTVLNDNSLVHELSSDESSNLDETILDFLGSLPDILHPDHNIEANLNANSKEELNLSIPPIIYSCNLNSANTFSFKNNAKDSESEMKKNTRHSAMTSASHSMAKYNNKRNKNSVDKCACLYSGNLNSVNTLSFKNNTKDSGSKMKKNIMRSAMTSASHSMAKYNHKRNKNSWDKCLCGKCHHRQYYKTKVGGKSTYKAYSVKPHTSNSKDELFLNSSSKSNYQISSSCTVLGHRIASIRSALDYWKANNSSLCIGKSRKAAVELFKLPDEYLSKHLEGKPIMLSNIMPLVKCVSSISGVQLGKLILSEHNYAALYSGNHSCPVEFDYNCSTISKNRNY